ncbi:hypothetical protein RRU94_02285 [Domibacillus sp. DTU_2020_1001157_1_SI_ALB_TIR_016]|uniref:hypothetical protein n=1 Tax=Domibacillus sp. DTU_2020_1001157_1_SI_ALB_TIR_016 TaxID=3077789 RepID=UPI0028E9DC20|nr:hypothetical protein [Domibacillus sp. DTU_2020_1001157_1_SI_ALB_TIR_016]WNS78794.1 hypothetical protein RRU94_02285 [Domibacillus sp. DTU_2020_1001157_1_SI_ALB_TIR_016]
MIHYKEEEKDEAASSRQIDLFGEPQAVCGFFLQDVLVNRFEEKQHLMIKEVLLEMISDVGACDLRKPTWKFAKHKKTARRGPDCISRFHVQELGYFKRCSNSMN